MVRDYPDPTDEQWEAIRSIDDHLLVASSAGTGKTYTIITRILYQLGVEFRGETCPSPIELSDVAAITFTNKAGAELKTKLRDALRAVGRRREAYRVDSARLGTIHSFCANVLREFALRTGRDPSMELVDEAEGLASQADSVRDALLTALEDKLIPGLEEIVAEYNVGRIEQQVVRLITQGDRLSDLVARVNEHAPREQAILRLAELARDTLVTKLESDSRVDYDRLVIWTRDLLRDDSTVRRALQRRIKVLFIDEFQDVDPVQREIAYLLGDPSDWRGNGTKLVLVGDPKQSIYRFRNADVTVWHDVERDFSRPDWKRARVVPLLVNRRSVPAILGLVDHTVGKLLDTPIDGAALNDYEIPYAPMTASREPIGERAVEVIAVPAAANGKIRPAPESRLIEAEAVAGRMRALHDDGGYNWHEMALLLCAWGDAEKYRAALHERGVPTYILRDEGFYACLEVTDALVALDAVRNPWNDRTLFGVLRSPFVGLTDESLLRIAQQCTSPRWSGLASVSLPDPREQERLSRGIALLSRMVALRDKVSTAELIDTLLLESGYLAHLELLGAEAKQRIANLQKLVRMARAMPDGGVGEFLEVAERQRELEAREGEAQLYGEREDVVTITSVHCAKGLDWRAVFWCDLSRVPVHVPKNELLIGRDRVLMNEAVGDAPQSFTDLWTELERERIAESKRLWYVAATRAKDLLVLSGVPLGNGGRSVGGSPAELFRGCFPRLDDGIAEYESSHRVRYLATVTIAAELDAATLATAESVPVDPATLAKPRDSVVVPFGRGRHSATELLSMSRCERRHWFRYVAGLKEPALHEHRKTDASNAIRRGLVVHDVLENYQEDVELGVLIEAAIGRWDPDAPPPEAKRGARYRRRLAAGVESILGSPEYRAVQNREGAERELGFTYVRGESEYIQGAIDLIAPSGDGYSIVDVKTSETDDDGAARKAEMYAPQRAAYAAAVEAITEAPVASFGFQFAGTGTFVGGARTNEQRELDSVALDRLIQLARAGERRLTAFPAECEFCGYRQAGWCAGVSPAPVVAEQALAAETES